MSNTSFGCRKRGFFPGQPRKVFEALTCPKKYILFTSEEGAEFFDNQSSST